MGHSIYTPEQAPLYTSLTHDNIAEREKGKTKTQHDIHTDTPRDPTLDAHMSPRHPCHLLGGDVLTVPYLSGVV